MKVRITDPITDDTIVQTICDACGEEGHDAPADAHDADGELQAPDGFSPTAARFVRTPGWDRDPLIAAAIAYEVAQDDFAADQFRQTRMRAGSRPSAWAPTITEQYLRAMTAAGVEFWQAAEDAGLVDLTAETIGQAAAFMRAARTMREAGFLRWNDEGIER